MTNAEILTALGINLDDPDGERYTSTVKLSALNTVLPTIASKAHTSLLRSMQAESNLAIPSTGYALPADYFRYVNGSLYLLYPIKWVTKIEPDNFGMMDNQFSTGSDADPLVYIWGSNIYLVIDTYSGDNNKLKLYYLKTPSAISTSGTCDLHPILHEPLLLQAEASLRDTYKYGTTETILALRKKADDLITAANRAAAKGEVLV